MPGQSQTHCIESQFAASLFSRIDRLLGGLALVAVAAVVSACATPGFERATGLPKFKPLSYKAAVQVVDSIEVLEQPALVLGTLKATTTKDVRADVAADFKVQARKYGCDAVVAVVSEREEKKGTRTIEVLSDGGKKVKQQQEFTTVSYQWQAQCVRTAAMGDTVLPVVKGNSEPVVVSAAVPKPAVATAAKVETVDSKTAKKIAGLLLARPAFVRSWRDKLEAPALEPIDVLDALAELMVLATGPTGLWRKTMPQEWFGCRQAPDSAQCKRLTEMETDFRKADALHDEVTRVGRPQAGGWLRRNDDRVINYLETYVPTEPSLSGIQATPLYTNRLRAVVP